MEPKVSVIVPIYNVEKYLNRCINSLIKQTYKSIEIILINDGSTDRSYEIAKLFEKEDPRIIVISQENQGQAKARNVGIDNSTGDYLLFVDSDDWIEITCIEDCLKKALDSNSELVIFDMCLIKKEETKYEQFGLEIFDSHSGPCNKFYSRRLWEGRRFPEGFWYEDLGVIPIIVGKCEKKIKLNKVLYNYDFTRENSQSHQINLNKNLDILKMLDLVYKELKGEIHSSKLEYLYIKHVVLGLILRKAAFTVNKKERKKLVSNAINELETKYPNWSKNNYYVINNNPLALIEKFLILLIKNRLGNLSAFLWKSFIYLNKLKNF